WRKGGSFNQPDLGTPSIDTTYSLCVYDTSSSGSTLATSLDIGPAPLWKSEAPKGLTYKDKAGTNGGVTDIQLKTGPTGKAQVKLSARGGNIPLPGAVGPMYFDQAPSVTVQLKNSAGKCWTSSFTPQDTTKNDGTSFKAQTR